MKLIETFIILQSLISLIEKGMIKIHSCIIKLSRILHKTSIEYLMT